MLQASLEPGKYSLKHKQWDTIRSLATAYSNQFRASARANSHPDMVGDADGKKYQRICDDPVGSLWFQKFKAGCKSRMGQDWRPNQAVSGEMMEALLRTIQEFAEDDTLPPERRQQWWLTGTFLMTCYVVSLRGPEGLLLDLQVISEHLGTGSKDISLIALFGKTKGEDHPRRHVFPCVNETSSGINVRFWLEKAVTIGTSAGRTTGPLLVKSDGTRLRSADFRTDFHTALCVLWDEAPDLFPKKITCHEDIEQRYDTFRSMRRGSETRAKEMNVSLADIILINRWQVEERAGTRKPNLALDDYYTQVGLLRKPFERYTRAM
jgi:hypothetical protein